MANRLLEALGPLGAIAGGLARGQLQAQQARQHQERQALLDAMTLQQSRSALETDRLQQQMLRLQNEGYEFPADRRRRDMLREMGIMQFAETLAAQRAAEAEARQREAIAELPGWYPTERDTTPVPLQGLAVPPMQQAAPLLDIAGPPKGMEALRQGWGQEITDNVNADHAVPGRVVQRRAEVAPTNPTAAELYRAGVLQGATVQDGMVTPLLRPILSPEEKEAQGLGLRKLTAETQTAETEALYAPRRAEAETGMLEKEAAYAEPMLQLKMEAEAAGIELTDMKIQEVMQKIEQGDQQTQFAVQGLTSPDPSVRQASAMTLLGQSYSMSGLDQLRLQRDYDQMNTQLEIAYLNSRDRALDRQVDWTNAETRRLQALISQDRTALDYEKFRQANLVSGQGGTKEQRSARDAAFKVMQGLVGETPAAPGQVARQLMAYMAEAGPYAYDIYNVFYGYMDAELDALGTGTLPPKWQSVPWEQMAAAAGVQPRRDYDRWREGQAAPQGATPSAGSGARPFVPNQRQPARRPDI